MSFNNSQSSLALNTDYTDYLDYLDDLDDSDYSEHSDEWDESDESDESDEWELPQPTEGPVITVPPLRTDAGEPVDVRISANPDGSVDVWCSDNSVATTEPVSPWLHQTFPYQGSGEKWARYQDDNTKRGVLLGYDTLDGQKVATHVVILVEGGMLCTLRPI